MHYHLILMRVLHHSSQLDIPFRRTFRDQHVVIRTNTVRIFRHLLHSARLKHPVVVVIYPTTVRLFLLGFIPVGIRNKLNQIEIHPHFGFQFILNTFQLSDIKTLQIDIVLLADVTILLQHFQRFRGNIFPFLMMEPRCFNFRINTDIFTGRVI
ncbi:Uncharacterised protein [Salmonella enterica subsp. enterica serovar Typhi]|nr:Uncharacterised protein [Salmonella enterica subsp. enterica serovar Typhi]